MKHIIFTTRFDPNFAVGACSIQLARDLEAMGHNVVIFSASSDRKLRKEFKVRSFAQKLPFSIQSVVIAFVALLPIKGARHSFEVPGFSWGAIHLHYDVWDNSKAPNRKFSIRYILRKAYRKALQYSLSRAARKGIPVVVPSQKLLKRIQPRLGSDLKYVILPNVLLGDDPILHDLVRGANKVNKSIGFVAYGDSNYKGISQALELLEQNFPDFKLSWAGVNEFEGPKSESLEIAGRLSRERFADWLLTQRGVIVASNFESFSMVALEAIVAGLPVLAVGELGITDFLKTAPIFGLEELGKFAENVRNAKNHKGNYHQILTEIRTEALPKLIENIK